MTFILKANAVDHLRVESNTERMSGIWDKPQAPAEIKYSNLNVRQDDEARTFWCYMQPTGNPNYTHETMRDISNMQTALSSACKKHSVEAKSPLDWFVMASSIPGIFSFGGDLRHFAERIKAGDHAAIRHYGHVAVEAIHRNTIAFDAPLVTIALVQGDALGGGFEHALSFDMIVAERDAKFGLPEILFNMFPGMGAYSFLSRRLGRQRAEALIMSGSIHTGQEMHEMGVVDILAEPGQGEQAVRDFITRTGRKHNALHATYQARRRVDPVTLDELRDVVDIWAAAAMNLTAPDLRRMARLVAAQDRRMGVGQRGAEMIAAE